MIQLPLFVLWPDISLKYYPLKKYYPLILFAYPENLLKLSLIYTKMHYYFISDY